MALDQPTMKEPGGREDFAHRLVGTTINGKYRVTRLIGRGGMGTVFEAASLESPISFALKFVHLGLVEDRATLTKRFLREAQIGQKLRHPGIAKIYELEVSDHDGTSLFIKMELLDGETLAKRIMASAGGLPHRYAIEIVRKVADALAVAHAEKPQIVHRDLKPDNILIRPTGTVTVLDFGLAFLAEERLTRTQQRVGTPHFAAPEQLEGKAAITPATDVYSLGATLYCALTAKLPIEANTFPEALAELATRPIVDVRERNPDVPEAIAAVVRKMMAVNPALRYQTMEEVDAKLAACLAIDDPLLGQTVWGRYVVEKKIGQGGMGAVYRLKHPELPNTFRVLKVMGGMADTDASTQLKERFQQEAMAAAAVPDHRVVKPEDFGKLSDGAPFIVMEYVDGKDLAEELKERGPFEVTAAVKIVARVADAMAHAHQANIIHRDLKPQNIMLKREGSSFAVKILDFGVARATGAYKVAHTSTTAVIGTPGYISPEGIAADPIDGRADVFSLGVVLFELLTGELPFRAATGQGMMIAALKESTPSVRERRPRHLDPVSPALERVLMHALEKDPARRLTMVEFERALLAPGADDSGGVIAAPLNTMLSVAPPSLDATSAPTLSGGSGKVVELLQRLTPLQNTPPPNSAPSAGGRSGAIVVAVVAVAIAAIAVALWIGHRAPASPTLPAAPSAAIPAPPSVPAAAAPAAPVPPSRPAPSVAEAAPPPTAAARAVPSPAPTKHHHRRDPTRNETPANTEKRAPDVLGID